MYVQEIQGLNSRFFPQDYDLLVAALKRFISGGYGERIIRDSTRGFETGNHAVQVTCQYQAKSIRIRLRGRPARLSRTPLGGRLDHYGAESYSYYLMKRWAELPTALSLIDQAMRNARRDDDGPTNRCVAS